jgi:hypothetical protein
MVDAVVAATADAVHATRSFLASEEGRRLRRRVASVAIVGAPLIAELPIVRRSPVARILRTAGLVTLVVKGAEWLRDWDPRVVPGLEPG